jgi:hypothetical protein
MKKLIAGICLALTMTNAMAQDCAESYKIKAKRRTALNNSLALGAAVGGSMLATGGALTLIIANGAIGAATTASTASAGTVAAIYGLEGAAIGTMAGGFSLINRKNQFDRIGDMIANNDSQEFLRFSKKLAKSVQDCPVLSRLGAEELLESSREIVADLNLAGELCPSGVKKIDNYKDIVNKVKAQLQERYQDSCGK